MTNNVDLDDNCYGFSLADVLWNQYENRAVSMKTSCQCGNAVYQLAKKVPIFIVKLSIGGLLNLLKLI